MNAKARDERKRNLRHAKQDKSNAGIRTIIQITNKTLTSAYDFCATGVKNQISKRPIHCTM